MYEKDLLTLSTPPTGAVIRRKDKFCEVLLVINNKQIPITSYRTSSPRRFFTLDTAVNRIGALFPHITEIIILQDEDNSRQLSTPQSDTSMNEIADKRILLSQIQWPVQAIS